MRRVWALLSISISMLWLTGCGMVGGTGNSAGNGTSPVAANVSLQGTVHGGNQAVSGATVQLWAVGTSGYGSSSTALIPSGSYYLGGTPGCTSNCYASVTTTANGGFNITGDYSSSCQSSNELVYLTATGGNPGLGGTVNNTALGLMAALGPCGSLSGSTDININEVTTVASVYALAQFMSSYSAVGSYSASTVGITNAFATVNNLVSISSGTALSYTPAGNGWVPQAEINSLANILASCVSTAGGTAGDNSSCGNLFSAATAGSSVPANTIQAALNIAQNPANNAGTLYGLGAPNGPFQPTLSATPNDWAMAVLYGGMLTYTSSLAIDGSGNIWTANGGNGTNNGGVNEQNNLGAILANNPYDGNTNGLRAIEIDLAGNAWVANYNTAQIYEISPGGASYSGPFSLPETDHVESIAVDASNNVWLVNTGSNTVSELSNRGESSQALSPSGGYTGGSLNHPVDVTPDASGNVWVTDNYSNYLTEITSGGSVQSYTGASLDGPAGITLDGSGDLWITNSTVHTVSEFNGGSQVLSETQASNIANEGSFPAVDGANHIWFGNQKGGSVAEYNTSGTLLSPSIGFQGPNAVIASTSYNGANASSPYSTRIDQSGNIWVIDYNPISIGSGLSAEVTEFIGLGAPTIEPLAQALLQGQVGVKPGTPTGNSLTVTTTSLPSSVNTAKYQYQLLAKGGSGNGYTWTITSGASTLSSVGLSLSSSGLISGTLSGTETGASITFKVTDSSSNTASKTLSLTVAVLTNLSITTTNLPSAAVGASYVENFAATGGSGSYSWSISSGQSALNGDGLGLSLSGSLNGTPTSAGSFPITVLVTDLATGQTSSAPYTVIVGAAGSSSCSSYDGSSLTVSGTVSYSGSKTGQIYLALIPSNCGGGGTVGTSISSAGAFTIHGVPSGTTFTLEAFMDTLGKGADNAADPTGSTSVTVSSSSVSGVSLTLADPSTVTLSSGPSIQTVGGFNTGVIAIYNAIQNNNGIEMATSYTLQWSTSSSFSTIAGSRTFPATGTHSTGWFLNGLTNGAVYYFRAYGTSAGTAVSPYSSIYGPVTIGAPTGGYAVSGSVSFSGTATGPLYAGFYNSSTNALYLEYFASPASAQAYTIQVPSGTYEMVGILDQNNDGAIDAGDIQNVNQPGSTNATITGATTNVNLTLPSGNSIASVVTQHYVSTSGVTQYYNLDFDVLASVKLPVAVTLASGPNAIEPIDIALCGLPGGSCGQGFQIQAYLGTTAPNVGDSYTFNVTYGDGTTGPVTAAVSAVLTGYASNLAPTGTSGSTTPTFSWTDPANASNYTYGFQLSSSNAGTIWEVPSNGSLTSATTSLAWGVDPTDSSNTPSVSSLTIGTNYSWDLYVIDSNSNQVITQANYTPSYSTTAPTITTSSIGSAVVSSAYSQTFTATGGSGNYTWSITSGLTALQAIGLSFTTGGVLSGTPTASGSYGFTVQVTDTSTTLTSSASFTLGISSAASSSCAHDGSGNALLNGNYAFLLSGFNPSGHFYDEIGLFKANGAGTITVGQADVNGDQNISAFSSGEQQYSFTGTYSIGSTDNRGTATFNNSNNSGTAGLPASASYCFVADDVVSGVAQSGRIIQADGSGFVLSGYFEYVASPGSASVATLNGGYAFGMQGVDGTNPNRKAMIGQFNLNGAGGVSSGQIDFSGVTYNSGTSSYVNSYTAASPISSSGSSYSVSTGRGTMTLNLSGAGTSVPVVFYVVGNGNQILMMTSNNANFPLLVGKAVQQTTTSFTTANVAAPGIFHANGITNPGSSSIADKVQVGQIVLNGSGSASFLADFNSGGNVSTPSSNSGSTTYTVSSIGYVVLAGSTPTNFYLYAPGAGFGLDGNLSTDLYVMSTQTVPSGGFTSSNLGSGSYGLGTVYPSAYNISNSLILNGDQYPQLNEISGNLSSGTLTAIQDAVYAPGTSSSYLVLDQSYTITYALDATYGPTAGRVLFQQSGTTQVIGYIISPTQIYLMTVNSGQNPQLVEGEHQ